MNVKNNKRRKNSQDLIERAFINLLQDRELKDISVTDLIKLTGLNRSTFYVNYTDILDLADKTRERLEAQFSNLFEDYDYMREHTGALKMFAHIQENRIFYSAYFKLCFDDKHLISIHDTERAQKECVDANLKYHIEFFRNGLNAIIKLWIAGGCLESPEEMAEVLRTEYRGRLQV